ncbi:MAG: Rdx family protein [Planctomycetes bacterium]|nr:Rdx family protein [Planctomycetota bacterium]
MAAAIRKQHPKAKVAIQPGGRGDFVVKADGKLLWDKKKRGDEFPEDQQILSQLPG